MRFWLFFWKHERDRRVAAVKVGRSRWTRTKQVRCYVPVESRYRGVKAQQPKFYLHGECEYVVYDRDTITIR